METLTQTKIIQKLSSSHLSLFTVSDFKKLFSIKQDNTAYKTIERLAKKGIFKRLTKKRYLFDLNPTDDFQIANFLYSPSYVSLETALSFYNIIDGFPYQITSITSKKTKTIQTLDKEFAYFRIKPKLFWGYEKKENFLIAYPEKALLDYLYFCGKGLRNFEPDDFDLKQINKKLLADFIKNTGSNKLSQIAKKTIYADQKPNQSNCSKFSNRHFYCF